MLSRTVPAGSRARYKTPTAHDCEARESAQNQRVRASKNVAAILVWRAGRHIELRDLRHAENGFQHRNRCAK
jgi:hypothetical protein